jgi:hypothetical protein
MYRFANIPDVLPRRLKTYLHLNSKCVPSSRNFHLLHHIPSDANVTNDGQLKRFLPYPETPAIITCNTLTSSPLHALLRASAFPRVKF